MKNLTTINKEKFIGKRVFAGKKIKGNKISKLLLSYIKKNKQKFRKVLYNSVASISSSMNSTDNRLDIGGLISRSISSQFPDKYKNYFYNVIDEHYDLKFCAKNRIIEERISVKVGNNIFENYSERNKKNKLPGKIWIKNVLGKNKKIKNKEWDWLLVIQRQNIKKNVKFGFGLISFSKFYEILRKNGEQKNPEIMISIYNNDWDFLFIEKEFLKEKSIKVLNNRYIRMKNKMFDALLNYKFKN